MMSVVCIAAILVPIGEIFFAWTCYPTTIHWAIPIAAGIPFGAGNTGNVPYLLFAVALADYATLQEYLSMQPSTSSIHSPLRFEHYN
jgi:hypothetical protein